MATGEAVRWTIKVSKETDRSLRTFLDARGMKRGDLSRFIEEAVLKQVFRSTVDDIHARNSDVDPLNLEAEIDQALREVRTETRKSLRGRRTTA